MAIDDTANLQPSLLPDYTQMIMDAVEALNEKEGSSKLAISNYIESSYNLHPAHSTLLSNSLEKLKQSGDLVFSNGFYLRAADAAAVMEGDAPAKRGRGRPPKPKVPVPVGEVPASPRPRGRPPKPHDPLAHQPQPMKTSSCGSGRPRGRPRKNPKEVVAAEADVVAGVKRGRGRPPKAKA